MDGEIMKVSLVEEDTEDNKMMIELLETNGIIFFFFFFNPIYYKRHLNYLQSIYTKTQKHNVDGEKKKMEMKYIRDVTRETLEYKKTIYTG